MKKLLAIFVFAVLINGIPRSARCDPDKDARKAFSEGVKAFNEGLLTTALEAFRRAYALRPSFRILYNIGQVEAELKHYDNAVEAFEGYLAQGKDRISSDRKAGTEKEIVRLRELVGEVTIKGTKGGEVWIDGERRGFLPLAGPIRLVAGQHELIVRQGSLKPCQKTISVYGGQPSEEVCLLLEEGQLSAKKMPDRDSVPLTASKEFSIESKPKQNNAFMVKAAPWMTAGLGLVTLTTGVICGLKATSLNRTLNSDCPDGKCPPERRSDVEALSNFAGVADGMFIATFVLSGVSTVLFIAPWKKKEHDD